MLTLNDGQCGLCKHFGEEDQSTQFVQIRTSKSAPEDLTAECGHPKLEPLNLIVTPISGCQGFEAAEAA
ncbi:MAG: hypothetical protein AAF328_06385 [Planctomycetota bacterium]